jgi:hypothetical protein
MKSFLYIPCTVSKELQNLSQSFLFKAVVLNILTSSEVSIEGKELEMSQSFLFKAVVLNVWIQNKNGSVTIFLSQSFLFKAVVLNNMTGL